MVLFAAVSGFAVAQNSKNLLEIDAASFRPVQTDALSGVAIDPIGLDRSKRPCARIKMHINRMTRDEIANIVVQPIGGNVILMKKIVASEGNGLILEMTAKAPTRFYLHHDEFGDSNEVSLNLEGDKEYWLEACLNQLYPITVNTNMKEASVYIDDVFKGKTNDEFYLLVHDVLPGDHTLRIVCGSSVSEKQISVYKESLVFRCDVNTVTARPQYVVFAVQPKNAVVTIDNKLYTPDEGGTVQVLLQNGAYKYSVESKDYYSESGSFVVDGKKLDKRVELRPAFGWLNVENTAVLNGANIYVDERSWGTIPLSRDLRLSSGEHKVRIVKHKYKPFEQIVTISDGQKLTFSPVLAADFAVVTINSAEGTEIWVNNERKGFAPWKGELASGTYIFEARKAGHRTTMITQDIAVDPHEQSYKIDAPKPIMGTLDITSSPANAEIYVDGNSVGRTPMMIDVIIGTRTVRLVKEGYGDYQSSVTVSESQTTSFAHKFDSVNAVFVEGKTLFENKNYAEALPKLRLAAKGGHAESCAYLGRAYQYGYGVEKNLTTAVSWYRQGADKGDAESQYRLGDCYYKGTGVTKDLTQAFKLFMKSAEQGNALAQTAVGVCYRNGYGVTKDETEAVKWYRRAAEGGNQTAQYNLGLCYQYGRGVAADKQEAIRWYQMAADQGHAKSKEKLQELKGSVNTSTPSTVGSGATSSSSRPTPVPTTTPPSYKYDPGKAAFIEGKNLFDAKDYSNALPKFKTAAQLGYAESYAYLGRAYQYGYGVEKNPYTAVSWYRQGADKGDAESQYRLGDCYYKGTGVTKDLTQAFKLFMKSAEQGNALAQTAVGVCYRNGYGVTKDETEAVKWYRRAAEGGNQTAQYNLGLCYQYGRGVTANKQEAIHWYQMAADQGHAKSKEKLQELGVSSTSLPTTSKSTSSTSSSSSSKIAATTTSHPTTTSSRSVLGNARGQKSNDGKFSVGFAAGAGFSSLTGTDSKSEGWEANAGLAMRILRWDNVVNINTGLNYMYTFGINYLSIPVVLNLNYTRKQNYSMYAGVGVEPSLLLKNYEGKMLSGFSCPLVANLLGYGGRNSDVAFYIKYTIGGMMSLGCRYTYYFQSKR